MNLSKLDLCLLSANLFALGGILVLITLRGPNGPVALLAVGVALMVIAKLSKALFSETP